MTYQPLTLKYRPRFWRDLVGQEVVVQTITNMLRDGKIVPGLIFGGSRGIGKTTSARILAKALNCPNRNTDSYEPCGSCDVCVSITDERNTSVQELDAASNGLVDDVRRIKEEVRYADVTTQYRVYIIDEAHGLTDKAWQAFLKLLEEPPPNILFVFCTTETHKIPDTIISRCANFTFARMTQQHITSRLQYISLTEQIPVEDGVLATIARHVNGGMRDAVSLLEQLSTYAGGKPINQDHVAYVVGSVNLDSLFSLLTSCAQADTKKTYGILQQVYVEVSDVASFVNELILFYRDLMFVKVGVPLVDTQPEYERRMAKAVESLPVEYLLHCQNELSGLAEQLARSRLPARSVVDIHIPRLFYGGLRSMGTQVGPQVATIRQQEVIEYLSAEAVASALGGTITTM